MYTRQFGLKEKPFSNSPDQRFLFLSEQHQEALQHLQDSFKRKGGVVLLTGNKGVGKTFLCRKFIEEISSDISVALILNSRLTAMDFLAAVCDELGISYNAKCRTHEEYLAALHSYLLQALPTGKKAALIIDDAHKLDSEIFIQLQKLTNSKNTPQKLLHVFLIGRPELLGKLKKPELASLLDDVTAEFRLPPLDKDEIEQYIEHRLSVAGGSLDVFSKEALESIRKHSRGNPQQLNTLCDRVMEMAYSRGNDKLNRTIVEQAAEDLNKKSKRERKKTNQRKSSFLFKILLLLLICLVGAALYTYFPFFKEQAGRLTSKITELSTVKKNTITPITPKTNQEVPVVSSEPAWLKVDDLEKNRSQALKDLFDQWKIDYIQTEGEAPKQFAGQHGLSFMTKQANWPGLLYLNAPAILEIEKTDGTTMYAVLIGSLDTNVIIKVNGNEYLLPAKSIQDVWTGRFSMLLK